MWDQAKYQKKEIDLRVDGLNLLMGEKDLQSDVKGNSQSFSNLYFLEDESEKMATCHILYIIKQSFKYLQQYAFSPLNPIKSYTLGPLKLLYLDNPDLNISNPYEFLFLHYYYIGCLF